MNFVADESCVRPVIQALREAGHDVVAIAEIARGATDDQVLEHALKEKRVLITEDRDFGELVYARGRLSSWGNSGKVSQPSPPSQVRNRKGGGVQVRFAAARCLYRSGARTSAHKQQTVTFGSANH
jgi:hypothetical protein